MMRAALLLNAKYEGRRAKSEARDPLVFFLLGCFWPFALRSSLFVLCLCATCLIVALPVSARTIALTAEDADAMASISAAAPRLSWVMSPPINIVFNTQPTLYWESRISVLMRIPIADHIPKGQRVTKAELTIAPSYLAGSPEIHVRRLLADWGTGVCHQYARTYPKKVEWTQP